MANQVLASAAHSLIETGIFISLMPMPVSGILPVIRPSVAVPERRAVLSMLGVLFRLSRSGISSDEARACENLARGRSC